LLLKDVKTYHYSAKNLVVFTVAKPGVERVKRPPGYVRNVVPVDETLAALHAAYTRRLTADRNPDMMAE